MISTPLYITEYSISFPLKALRETCCWISIFHFSYHRWFWRFSFIALSFRFWIYDDNNSIGKMNFHCGRHYIDNLISEFSSEISRKIVCYERSVISVSQIVLCAFPRTRKLIMMNLLSKWNIDPPTLCANSSSDLFFAESTCWLLITFSSYYT